MAEESSEVKSAGPSSPRSPHSSGAAGTGGSASGSGAGASGSGGSGIKATSPRSPRQTRRMKLTEQQLESFSKEELAAKWREQDMYMDCLESQTAALEGTEIT